MSNFNIGDEVVILEGPFQSHMGILIEAPNPDSNNKWNIEFNNGCVGHFVETDFKATNRNKKFPSCVKQVKGDGGRVELIKEYSKGTYVSIPKSDIIAVCELVSQAVKEKVDIHKLREITQRWNVGLREMHVGR